MKYLRNVRFKPKLLFISVLPMILLFSYALYTTYENFARIDNYHQTQEVLEVDTSISKAVHELQKERGMTAGYLGSKGVNFGDKLQDQRKVTDKALINLNETLANIDVLILPLDLSNKLANLNEKLGKLSLLREQVTNQSIEAKEAIGYYTSVNGAYLDFIGSSAALAKDPKIGKNFLAYYNFLLAKERAGIERALGSNILAAQSFAPGIYKKFVEMIASQDAYMNEFKILAETKNVDFYNDKVKGEAVDTIIKLRVMILDEQSFDAKAPYWFDQMTQKINLLKEVDDYLAEDLLTQINEKLDRLKFYSYLIALGTFLLLVILNIAARATYIDIAESIEKIEKGIDSFIAYLSRQHNLYEKIELEGNDELGNLAKFINDNALRMNQEIEDDMLCAGETILTLNKMQQGDFRCRTKTLASTPQVQTFVNLVNQTIDKQTELYSSILAVLKDYTNYNYTTTIDVTKFEGEYKELAMGINGLRDSIVQMLNENKQTGSMLSSNSDVLLDNVNILNTNANQAAAALEETAAAVEEITTNITASVNNIIKMASNSNILRDSSIKGQKLAQDTTTSMDNINSEINAINDAITVIDQIAFQTNILSLNAAVEAATAGEAGKGFAVVAGEVRNLANRSADAANEIKTLVQSATQKALQGKDISDQMIQGYRLLASNLDHTTQLIHEVEIASKEQQSRIVQINHAIGELDHQTQQNANIALQTQEIANKTAQIASDISQKVSEKSF